MTLVNDPSEHRYTSFKLTKGNYATEAVLTSRSSATSLSYPEINGRGMNSVPHQRCMGTGNSIWTSPDTSSKATITAPSGTD